MEDSYRTIDKPAQGMFRDRNSRFLAFGYPVRSVEEIDYMLNSLHKKYHDARHHCYAYRLGFKKDVFRMNDDGEPSGTAGKPIYNQLLSNDLTDILVVVVRYFGGTLLGTGGLINAYRSATTDMLSKALIVIKYVEDHYMLRFPYESLNMVMKLLKEEDLVPLQPVFDAQCTMEVAIKRGQSGRLAGRLSAIPGVVAESLQMTD